MFTENYIKENI